MKANSPYPKIVWKDDLKAVDGGYQVYDPNWNPDPIPLDVWICAKLLTVTTDERKRWHLSNQKLADTIEGSFLVNCPICDQVWEVHQDYECVNEREYQQYLKLYKEDASRDVD